MKRSKAGRIRDLYEVGLSVQEIAAVVECKEEYVRVCARQRKDGMSVAEESYAIRKFGSVEAMTAARSAAHYQKHSQRISAERKERYRTDQEFAENLRARNLEWHRNNRERKRAYARKYRLRKRKQNDDRTTPVHGTPIT